MNKREFTFPSATGVCEIYCCEYTPESGCVKAVIALHHGMAEHQQRYIDFIEYLVSKGYAVFMHDMANHGRSNQKKDELGYFGEKDGYSALIQDYKTIVVTAKSKYPDKKLVIMGHSMGSFIARCFDGRYPELSDCSIYIGTGGPNPAAGIGDKLSLAVAKAKGKKHKSSFLDKMTFGTYNNKFEKRTTFDWLTRDNDIVDKYINDPLCGFLFTVQGMNDLVKLNIEANSDKCFSSVRKNLPVLVVSGEMDPVGNYGKGVTQVYEKLKATGHQNAQLKLFKDCRHEVLNEHNKQEVYDCINSFIENNVLGD